MPDNWRSAIRTREMHIGFKYSFFFQIWNRNTSFKLFGLRYKGTIDSLIWGCDHSYKTLQELEKMSLCSGAQGEVLTSKNPTLPIFWLSACSAFIWFNSSVTSLLFPRKNSSDFLAPSRSPLETRKIGDLGIQNIQSPRTAGKMIQIPEKSRHSVSQFKLSKNTPKKTINCIHEPKAPRYLQRTVQVA